jgi:thiamine biosynthesis lipoprotein
MLLCLVGLARLDGRGGNDEPAPAVAAGNEAERVRGDWWETRRYVYDGIPAWIRFHLPEGEHSAAQALADRIWKEFKRIGAIFNDFDPTSEVSRLNRASRGNADSRTLPVSVDLYRVIETSNRLFAESGGGFDPTVRPIRRLWRDAARSGRPPSDAEIDWVLKRVGLARLRAATADDGARTVTLPESGVELDFGAIAKGHAVDRVEELLRGRGVPAALVVLGGDVCAFGDNDGEPWRIGIQHPREEGALWSSIAVPGKVRASTSGNYRQPLRIADKVYYHIFDPRTGRPVSTRVESVTTLDMAGRQSNALLDGAATAVAVLGPSAGLELARRLGIDALILVSAKDGAVEEVMTDGFRALLRRERLDRAR